MARGSKPPSRHHFINWLLAGVAVACAYIFLFPAHPSTDLGNPTGIPDHVLEQEVVKFAVPLSRDDPSQTEVFVFRRGDHLWNSVSEFCVRVHAAGAVSPSWPWPSLQALLQTVHDEAVKAMGPVTAADADRAYILRLNRQKMTQVTLSASDGRKLSIAVLWNEERATLRQRAARFSELHGFQASEPAPHVIECIMLAFSFLNLKQPEGTLQWIVATIPKYFSMISNSSFGTRSSGRKVFIDVGSRNAEFFTILNGLSLFDGFEWWLIECNPRRREYLQTVVEKFGRTTAVQFLPMAAWTENTTLSFHIDDDVAESDHGSSLFGDHAMVHADGLKTEVNALDFPKFLESHFQKEDFLLCRMDIEGAEYSVIGSLLESGSAALFDYLDVEWHGRLAPSLHKYQQLDSVYESRLREAGVEVDSGNFYDEVKCSSKGGEMKCFQKK